MLLRCCFCCCCSRQLQSIAAVGHKHTQTCLRNSEVPRRCRHAAKLCPHPPLHHPKLTSQREEPHLLRAHLPELRPKAGRGGDDGLRPCEQLQVAGERLASGWQAAGERLASGWRAAGEQRAAGEKPAVAITGERLASSWRAAGERLASGWRAAGERLASRWHWLQLATVLSRARPFLIFDF